MLKAFVNKLLTEHLAILLYLGERHPVAILGHSRHYLRAAVLVNHQLGDHGVDGVAILLCEVKGHCFLLHLGRGVAKKKNLGRGHNVHRDVVLDHLVLANDGGERS